MVPKAKARVAQSEILHAALRTLCLPVFEDIAHTSQSSNQRLLPLAIHLAAQAVYVNIHNIGIGLNAHTPNLVENHRARDDAARIPAEIFEQDEFLGGKLQRLAGTGGFTAKQVQLKIENTQPSCLVAWRA